MVALIATGYAPALAWGAVTQQSAKQPPAAGLVLDGVTVIDVSQGNLVPDQRVVIVGNRIQSVGSVASAGAVPKGAQVVDARGKYLIPGLWDLHVHTGQVPQMYSLLLANGVTGIRDASSKETLDTLRSWRRQILAGTLVGPPRQILSGAAIDEVEECSRTELIHQTCVSKSDTADGRRIVHELKDAGVDMIKMYDLSKEMYFTIAAEARRIGIPFGGHIGGSLGRHDLGAQLASAIEASDSGAKILDHVNSAGGLDSLCLGPQASIEKCRPTAERLRQNGTWWVTTLIHRLLFNGSAEPNPKLRARAIAQRVSDFTNEFWTDSLRHGNWLRTTDAAADSLGFLQIMQRVGMPILAGTDAIGDLADRQPPGFSLHAELAIYATEGLTPLNALQTATLNPAKFLHATDSLGTVAPGKLADLVLLDADPLADITNTTTIRAVIANGRYYDRAALDGLLADARSRNGSGGP